MLFFDGKSPLKYWFLLKTVLFVFYTFQTDIINQELYILINVLILATRCFFQILK